MVEFNRKEMLKLENIKVIAKKYNIDLKINCHSISYITHLGKVHSLDKFNSKSKKLFKKKKANGNSMIFESDFAEENERVVTFDHEEDLMETEGNDVEVNATGISRNIAEENESDDTLDEEDLMETKGDSMSVEKNVEEENESDDTLDNEEDLIECRSKLLSILCSIWTFNNCVACIFHIIGEKEVKGNKCINGWFIFCGILVEGIIILLGLLSSEQSWWVYMFGESFDLGCESELVF